jgi:hypothetical protein
MLLIIRGLGSVKPTLTLTEHSLKPQSWHGGDFMHNGHASLKHEAFVWIFWILAFATILVIGHCFGALIG